MAMQDQVNATPAPKRVPWNKGKLTGAKPPLRPKHVWSIRTKLQIEGRTRDLAMFNLAIDSKLRGCDVVAIRVEDVAAGGYTADRATVRQKKTKRPVRFELSEQTRQAVDEYLKYPGRAEMLCPSSNRRFVLIADVANWQIKSSSVGKSARDS
jgi:integrase